MLDPLRRLAAGAREDKSDDMSPLIADLANLARELDVAIVLLHHRSSKNGAQAVRGSSAIEDQADIVFTLDHKRDGVCVLKPRKYRIGMEPEPIWLRIASTFESEGKLTLSASEALADDGDEQAQTIADRLTQTIRALAPQVASEGGWSPGKLALALGRSQQDRGFREALGGLLASGEWEAIGKTRNRRVRPSADSGHSGTSQGKARAPSPPTNLD